MASLKTVEYFFPWQATVTDNTLTALGTVTINLPENGKVFRSCWVDVFFHDATATVANTQTRRVTFQLGAATKVDNSNSNLLTHSAEQMVLYHSVDVTSHFTSNWSGTSMTATMEVLFDSLGTSPIWRNISARVVITYEYDETTTTHVKTVYIPLDAPAGYLAGSKPGTANAIIPALDTFLPEASKTIHQTALVLVANAHAINTTADITYTMEVGTNGAFSTAAYGRSTAADFFFRAHTIQSFATNTEHDFFIWSNAVNQGPKCQVWLQVTYSFDSTAANRTLVSLLLPMENFPTPFGNSSALRSAQDTELFIAESNVTSERVACYMYGDTTTNMSGVNGAIGASVSPTAYTDNATSVCGSNCFMLRDDTNGAVARGRNLLRMAVWRTGGGFLPATGFWMVCYSCDKPTGGYHKANHTVQLAIQHIGTGAAGNVFSNSFSFSIPESDWFINDWGMKTLQMSNTTGGPTAVGITIEQLAAENEGHRYLQGWVDAGQSDPEVGVREYWTGTRRVWRHYPGETGKLVESTARAVRMQNGNQMNGWNAQWAVITYHSITYTVSGTVSGSSGGNVNIQLVRERDRATLKTTSRTGNGAYSFTWYDNTENVYAVAIESDTLTGVSQQEVAA